MGHVRALHIFPLLLLTLPAAPTEANPLVYEGDAGPGRGKHIVLIASDHEYRSEETLPALARILARRRGFKCTVLFGVDEKGVREMWVQCGGYNANPLPPSEVLAMAQPLLGMEPDSEADPKHKPVPGAWTRTYRGKSGNSGRVFTSTYGASNDIENEGFRRMLINACFWAAGLEEKIAADADVRFVGPYHATWRQGRGRRKPGLKPQDLAGWETPIVPLQK